MFEIAYCDDHHDALSNMTDLLNQYQSTRHINCKTSAFSSGFELISLIEKGKRFSVYCLDILMPHYSGIEVAKEIRRYDKAAPIIFLTSSPEFALAGYGVKAMNYILKPISADKLFAVLDDALEQVNQEKKEKTILVKSHDGLQKLRVDTITYVEVIGRSILYHLFSGRVVECTESFSTACDMLLSFGSFVKTHRSYIVNMQFIETIESNQVKLQTQSIIPIAQGKVKEIKLQYLAYQMEDD